MNDLTLLAAADLHGIFPIYEWLVETANRRADVLVLAGDLFDADFPEGQRQQATRIVALLREARPPVLYLMGNDDEVELGYEDARIQSVHGRCIEVGGFSFVGYQYTNPFVGDVFVKPEAEIARDLEQLGPLLDSNTVLVTHMPAFGSCDQTFGDHVGGRSLAAMLFLRPVLAHIHGHIHGAFGRDGIHFNAACAGLCRAILIELPSLQHEVIEFQRRG